MEHNTVEQKEQDNTSSTSYVTCIDSMRENVENMRWQRYKSPPYMSINGPKYGYRKTKSQITKRQINKRTLQIPPGRKNPISKHQ